MFLFALQGLLFCSCLSWWTLNGQDVWAPDGHDCTRQTTSYKTCELLSLDFTKHASCYPWTLQNMRAAILGLYKTCELLSLDFTKHVSCYPWNLQNMRAAIHGLHNTPGFLYSRSSVQAMEELLPVHNQSIMEKLASFTKLKGSSLWNTFV